MALEKKLLSISPIYLIADGTQFGVVTVSDTLNFKDKQTIFLKSSTAGPSLFQIKRVISKTQFIVGKIDNRILPNDFVDISNFTVADGAIVGAEEQDKTALPTDKDHYIAIYETSPINADRIINVDPYGNFYTKSNPLPIDFSGSATGKTLTTFLRNGIEQIVTEDTVTPANNRPLPVKLTGFDGDVIINPTNLNIDVQNDGFYDGTGNIDPDSIGIIAHERSVATDKTKQTQRVTAKRGTVDTDTISQDISLHDKNSNGIDSTINSSGRSIDALTPDNTVTGSLSALNQFLSMSLSGLGSVGFQVTNGGNFIGTLVAQCSLDDGISWKTVPFLDVLNSAVHQYISLSSPNPLEIFSIIPLGGSSHVRLLAIAYTSGLANIVIRGSKIIGTTGQVTSAAFATVNNTYVDVPKNTPTLILAANPNRKYAYISNNSSNIVNIQLGSSTGLTAVTGLVINSNESREIKGDNLFTGNVYAYTGGVNVKISVTEGTP